MTSELPPRGFAPVACSMVVTGLTLGGSFFAFIGSFHDGAPPLWTLVPFVLFTALGIVITVGALLQPANLSRLVPGICLMLLLANAFCVLAVHRSLLVVVLFDLWHL